MRKLVKKLVEAYAKHSTTASWGWYFHQVKSPRSLIEK